MKVKCNSCGVVLNTDEIQKKLGYAQGTKVTFSISRCGNCGSDNISQIDETKTVYNNEHGAPVISKLSKFLRMIFSFFIGIFLSSFIAAMNISHFQMKYSDFSKQQMPISLIMAIMVYMILPKSKLAERIVGMIITLVGCMIVGHYLLFFSSLKIITINYIPIIAVGLLAIILITFGIKLSKSLTDIAICSFILSYTIFSQMFLKNFSEEVSTYHYFLLISLFMLGLILSIYQLRQNAISSSVSGKGMKSVVLGFCGILFIIFIIVMGYWFNAEKNKIYSQLSPICSSNIGIDQTAPYNKTNDLAPIVLLTSSGKGHEWNFKLPSEWKPKSIDQVQLVQVSGCFQCRSFQNRIFPAT